MKFDKIWEKCQRVPNQPIQPDNLPSVDDPFTNITDDKGKGKEENVESNKQDECYSDERDSLEKYSLTDLMVYTGDHHGRRSLDFKPGPVDITA